MFENFRNFSKSAPTFTIVPMKRGVGVVTTKSGCGPFALLGERMQRELANLPNLTNLGQHGHTRQCYCAMVGQLLVLERETGSLLPLPRNKNGAQRFDQERSRRPPVLNSHLERSDARTPSILAQVELQSS